MLYRTIFLSAVFAFSTNALADDLDLVADLDPDLEELSEISETSTKMKSNVERRQASFDALDEEDDFEMDLTSVAPTQVIDDPDAELELTTPEAGLLEDTDAPLQNTATNSDLEMDIEEIEEAPPAADPSAKDLDWSLDLDEDIEITAEKSTPEQKSERAPETLDFLEE